MYRERINSYYPPTIRSIQEFQSIIDGEYPEFELLEIEKNNIINNAYLSTMNEERIEQWEKLLKIKPYNGSTIEDRREVIIARLIGQGKLNTETINTIVSTFTGGTAESWFKDGVVHIKVQLPLNNKSYILDNLVQELELKIPIHLGCEISLNYNTWNDIKVKYPTWQDVLDAHDTWYDVLYNYPKNIE